MLDGPTPFDRVTWTREKHADGTPTGWYVILGERDGGERSIRVPGGTLLDQADDHIRYTHGVGPDEPINGELYAHALMRSAVALLID